MFRLSRVRIIAVRITEVLLYMTDVTGISSEVFFRFGTTREEKPQDMHQKKATDMMAFIRWDYTPCVYVVSV